MLCTYTGTDARTYPDYADTATGRALEPIPGVTYDVRVAPGRNPGLPLPPGDGRWAQVPDDGGQDESSSSEDEAPEPAAQSRPGRAPAGRTAARGTTGTGSATGAGKRR